MPNGGLPDTGERTFRRWELRYRGSLGATILVFTAKQGWRLRAARLLFSPDTTEPQVTIPGADTDRDSHLREITIRLPISELFPVIERLDSKGKKKLFGNEQSHVWWVEDRDGNRYPAST